MGPQPSEKGHQIGENSRDDHFASACRVGRLAKHVCRHRDCGATLPDLTGLFSLYKKRLHLLKYSGIKNTHPARTIYYPTLWIIIDMVFWRIVNSELFNIRSILIQISERFSLSLDLTTHDLQTYIFDLFPSKKETRRPVQGSSLSGNRDYGRNCRTNRAVIGLFQYWSLIQYYNTSFVFYSQY